MGGALVLEVVFVDDVLCVLVDERVRAWVGGWSTGPFISAGAIADGGGADNRSGNSPGTIL